MIETVVVVPTFDHDSNGNPVPQGAPVELTPLEIAPGNAAFRYGMGGDLTDIEFTVYLPLHMEPQIKNGDEVRVRGRRCTAMVQVWRSQRGGNRGGIVVLARSKSGKAS